MQKPPSDSSAAVARHLAFLGKALGQADLLQDVLPARVLPQPGAAGAGGEQACSEPGRSPDQARLSAIEKLTHQATAPVPHAAPPAPATYKSWGGRTSHAAPEGRAAAAAPNVAAQTNGADRRASSVDRLRETARGLAPKRLESRDNDQWAAPLINGGAKLPATYPDEVIWPSNSRPPGSLHDDVAWWCAKTDKTPEDYAALDEGSRDRVSATAWVMEIMGAVGSVLMRIPKQAPDGTQANGAGAPFGQMFDSTMLVIQDGRPRFAGAAEPRRHRHGETPFWVIRPRSHYLEADTMQSLYCNATWTSRTQEVSPGPQNASQEGEMQDPQEDADAPSMAP